MHWLEKKCISIRRSKFLEPIDGLWGSVRPVYDLFWTICFQNGLKRFLNGTDMILVAAECRGVQEVYEPDVWTHMMQRVKSGYRIADVGANIGLYAMALGKRVGDEGALFAFEPDQDSFKILKKT